jgi:hypothetical protein
MSQRSPVASNKRIDQRTTWRQILHPRGISSAAASISRVWRGEKIPCSISMAAMVVMFGRFCFRFWWEKRVSLGLCRSMGGEILVDTFLGHGAYVSDWFVRVGFLLVPYLLYLHQSNHSIRRCVGISWQSRRAEAW